MCFFYKMVGLYKDPEGKNVFTMEKYQTNGIMEDTSESLQRRISQLEAVLQRKVHHMYIDRVPC